MSAPGSGSKHQLELYYCNLDEAPKSLRSPGRRQSFLSFTVEDSRFIPDVRPLGVVECDYSNLAKSDWEISYKGGFLGLGATKLMRISARLEMHIELGELRFVCKKDGRELSAAKLVPLPGLIAT